MRTLTPNEWTLLASVPFWIWLLLLMLIQFRPAWKPALRTVVWASGLIALAFGLCVVVVLSTASSDRAVVIHENVPIHFGPLDDSPSPLTVHDGAEIRVVDQKDAWLLVSVGNRNGWLKREQVFLPENFQTRSGEIK